MDEEQQKELWQAAQAVLQANDRGKWTVPAGKLYPHQWLWDSCFIAIGLRHMDASRAAVELNSLFRGQWANGMLPNIIFADGHKYRRELYLWQSWLNPHSPNGLSTSGLTQPPLLAEAIVRVGEKLKLAERRSWFRRLYPHLVDYHLWLYRERDPHRTGLVSLIHPYESGMDNSPPWISEIRARAWPWWLSLAIKLRLDGTASWFRRDVRHVPSGQRVSNSEAIASWNLIRQLRAQDYDSKKILKRPKVAMEDLAFNSILIRANDRLSQIAKTLGEELPQELQDAAKLSESALERLWDEQTGQYYSRSLVDGRLVLKSSIATFLPLYAGVIDKSRAERLVGLLKKRSQFRANWPVPSAPVTSRFFNPVCYWQGPAWLNMNWLIIDGLERYGFHEEAKELKERSLQLVAKNGAWEYFNPLNGEPAGAPDFSWTAALALDLLKN